MHASVCVRITHLSQTSITSGYCPLAVSQASHPLSLCLIAEGCSGYTLRWHSGAKNSILIFSSFTACELFCHSPSLFLSKMVKFRHIFAFFFCITLYHTLYIILTVYEYYCQNRNNGLYLLLFIQKKSFIYSILLFHWIAHTASKSLFSIPSKSKKSWVTHYNKLPKVLNSIQIRSEEQIRT